MLILSDDASSHPILHRGLLYTPVLLRQGYRIEFKSSTAVTAEMEAGTDPADPKAQELAKRWLALVTLCTGGDPGIFNSLRSMYENEDNVMGMDTKAIRLKMEYILKAAAAAGIKQPRQ